jgi:hypothetical protein
MDPANPVVKLCSQGMQAEAEGRDADARALFRQAWEESRDDYEACVAAHYLARHQPTPELTLHWNRTCLQHADAVNDDRVKGFYASLHLNIAKACLDLGDPAGAREHFALAADRLQDAPPGQYTDWLRFVVAEELRATGAISPRSADACLTALLTAFRTRGDLKSLALLLPSYLGDLGTDEDLTRLTTALHTIHASRWLPEDEQHTLSQAIATLTAH